MSNNIIGISCGSHDAAISVIKNNEIIYASQSERFSGIKNDKFLNDKLLKDIENYTEITPDDTFVFYERPFFKKTRQLYSGQYHKLLDDRFMDIKLHIKNITKIHCVSHHKSHAATAFCSPYEKCIVFVCDAIGEWDCTTFWLFENNRLKKLKSIRYPNSIGLFYSAMTKHIGFRPNEQEYIVMGLSGFGKEQHGIDPCMFLEDPKNDFEAHKIKHNYHKGLPVEIENILKDYQREDIAYLTQQTLEKYLNGCMRIIKHYMDKYKTENLVYSGGVSLNCLANRLFIKNGIRPWIFPNPGDSGSSLGCALYYNGKHIDFKTPYLGYNIQGEYPVEKLYDELLKNKICGVANGRAEFGPRALGNRSILADPRDKKIKDRMNDLKFREKFRPFAPVILEECFGDYFETKDKSSPYMQFVYKCKKPMDYPAIIHIDDTSRVQTVNENQNAGLYRLLKMWYEKTGCPMLLNTSLNIKGKPIVNDEYDAMEFENHYKIKVF